VDVDEEIRNLVQIRDYANARIRELRSLKKIADTTVRYPPKPEVPQEDKLGWMYVADLAPFVNDWDGTWTQLAENSGVAFKTITSIRDRQTQYVREDIGDAIMMALGLPHITIEVVKERPIQYKVPDPPPSKYFEE
jgi:hypothetical protein